MTHQCDDLARITSPLGAALYYATVRGYPVFPCHWQGERRKQPLLKHGLHDASSDPAVIRQLWARWPSALIGLPAGSPIKAVVLDIDVKDGGANGYDTLDELGFAILPETPMVHTASGGLHLHFAAPPGGLRNTNGARGRGIGPGLDWRGDGGYVIAPSPGSGYTWDPIWNLQSVELAPVPAALRPREPEREAPAKPTFPETGLSPRYAAALDNACRRIANAPCLEQESTLNAECFSIGTLAGSGSLPADVARRALLYAAHHMPSYDRQRPWVSRDLIRKVDRAFTQGMRQPRRAVDAA
jgi:hypothetical protein